LLSFTIDKPVVALWTLDLIIFEFLVTLNCFCKVNDPSVYRPSKLLLRALATSKASLYVVVAAFNTTVLMSLPISDVFLVDLTSRVKILANDCGDPSRVSSTSLMFRLRLI